MTDELHSLPWDRIEHTQDEIPWPAMRTFANALATNRELVPRLIEIYDRAYEAALEETGCADFYVAGIFVLAAPHLDDEMRREIGSLLIERLVRAGQDDADTSLEVMLAAAGSMGPVILPAVLDAIAAEPDTSGAWFFLWSLTLLAARTDDPFLRDRVIHACAHVLERADRREIDLDSAGHAAITLAVLKHTEHTELLRRLSDRFMPSPWPNEYAYALDILENRTEYSPPPEMWDRPVGEWLTPQCRTAMTPADEVEETEDYEEEYDQEEQDPEWETATLVAAGFVASPIAAALPADLRKDAYKIAERLLYESSRVLDRVPRAWDEPTLRKLLLEVLPGRLPADRELLEKVIPVAEAILYWFQFKDILTNGDTLARAIHGWTDQVVAAGLDPKSRASDKPLLVEAMEAGLDPLDPEFTRSFMKPKSSESTGGLPSRTPRQEAGPQEPPIPIVEHRAKIARNAPCPCGSGKKYKKCHGRDQTATPAD